MAAPLDYTHFSGIGQGSRSSTGRQDYAWWKMEPDAAAESINGVLLTLLQQQRVRLRRNMRSARLYGNVGVFGRVSLEAARPSQGDSSARERLGYNVVQSGVDTLVSKIAKNRPEPFFLTSDGNYHERRRAKKLNRFMRGVFYETKAYDRGVACFRDGLVWGDGLLHVYARNGRVHYERVFPSEIYVDEIEAIGSYGGEGPRSLHWVKEVDRDVMLGLYPGARNRKLIEDANRSSFDGLVNYPQTSNVITVRESWHLPSGPGAKDGRHLISVEGGALKPDGYDSAMMPWTRERFPFAQFQWNPRLSGFWAQGVPEQVETIQFAIYDLLYLIQRCHRLMGNPVILMEMGSQIAKAAFNNEVGAVIKYSKVPPTYLTHQIVSAELYAWIAQLKQLAYDQMGISQLSATAQKPAGLNSGRALREYNDIESERFMVPGQRYESFFLSATELTLDVVRDLVAANDEGYLVTVPGRRDATQLNWKDLALDNFVTQCFPISSLPNSPAGRMQTVQEWVQAGWIDQDDAQRLLNFPDLAQRDNLRTAAEEYLTKILDQMVDEGRYTPPEPYNDLMRAKTLGYQYYNEGLLYDLEEERLELLRRFIGATEELLKPPPAPAMPGAPGMPTPGAPVPNAPPVPPAPGELVPNTPQQPTLPMPVAA